MVKAILIVEDDPAVGQSLALLVRLEGIEAVLATSCADALAIGRSGAPFELIYIDQHLPDGEGLDLIGALKGYWPAADWVLMSGLDPTTLRADARASEFTALVQKPLSQALIQQFQRGAR